jgi:large subunit ribosomal protein L25
MKVQNTKLHAEKRNLSKPTHKILKNNFVPGALVGRKFDKSIPIKVEKNELLQIFNKDREVFILSVQNETFPVQLLERQDDPVTHKPIHVTMKYLEDNYVSHMNVPIVYKGVPRGVKEGANMVRLYDSLTVSGKVSKIPRNFTIDVSKLDINDSIKLGDLDFARKYDFDMPDGMDTVLVTIRPTPKMKMIHEGLEEEIEPDTEQELEPEIVNTKIASRA